MTSRVPRGLRIVFLLHALALVPASLVLVFAPSTWADLVEWGSIDVTFVRLLGAALLAVSFGAFLASRVRNTEAVRVYFLFELALGALFVVVAGYEVVLGGAPAFAWSLVVVPGAFTVARLYYLRYFLAGGGAGTAP
jgi:hypothetical protein